MCGALGATAGMANMLGLDAATTRSALGIAYSQLSGTMQAHIEGSPVLPMQIGFNARAALLAAELASRGIAGPADFLEGVHGYFTLIDPERDPAAFADFEPAAMADPRRLALADRIGVQRDDNPSLNALSPQRVEIRLRDGSRHTLDMPAVLGAPGRPLDRTRHLAKFRRAAASGARPLGEARTEALIGLVDRLEDLDDVRRLVDALVPA